MKTNLTKLMLLALVAIFTFASCEKDDDNESSKWIVTLGAQSNPNTGAFYSISEKKVYTQADAFNNQEKIDLLCFYENTVDHQNFTTLSSPGANITDIFTGETSVEYYDTKNLTKFTLPATDLTVEQFDQIENGNEIIATYFDFTVTSGYKKAKELSVDDIYAFLTQDGTYGLFRVIELSNTESESGWIKVELKTCQLELEL